jgi:hypothetical protein
MRDLLRGGVPRLRLREEVRSGDDAIKRLKIAHSPRKNGAFQNKEC